MQNLWKAALRIEAVSYTHLEFRLDEDEKFELGQEITVADFEEGKKLDITGISKGKGTQGNIKRHGHHRGPMSHGSKHKRLAGALAVSYTHLDIFTGKITKWSEIKK